MLIVTGLFSVFFTIVGNYYVLSKYRSHDVLISTLQENSEYVIPVTEYIHTARFIEDELQYFGVFPVQREPFSEIKERLNQVVDNRATVLESYYLQKNFQDFLNFHISIAPPYSFSPYISTNFTDVIIIDDFSKLHLSLSYGSTPVESNEVLIYDYMAHNLLKIETLGFMEMGDLIDYSLVDIDTQLELKISGIIKTNYEKYAYTENGNYHDFPFEAKYLARLQSIYALPEFLDQFEIEFSYFSFNEITFTKNLTENINETNNFYKFRMIHHLDQYEFIGSVLDYESGILLSKHQFASVLNLNPIEIDADLVNSYVLEGVVRYLWIDESTDKSSRATILVPIIGVYESDEFDSRVIDFLFGEDMDHIKLNGSNRMNYLMLGSDWSINSKLLSDMKPTYLPYSFFIENPNYEVYGFTEYTPYSIIIDEVNGYVDSIKEDNQINIYLALGLFVLSIVIYTYNYNKRHSDKIATLIILGANHVHLTLVFALQFLMMFTISFVASLFPILTRMTNINNELSKNLPYDVFFFTMSIFDFLIIYAFSFSLLLVGVLFIFIRFRTKLSV